VLHINTAQDLITNFAIVTAFLFLCSQVIFKNNKFGDAASLLIKCKIGIVTGLLGIVLMLFTVSFDGTILDFRQLAVLLAALFGGVFSALLTGMILFVMRLFISGEINMPNVIAALNVVVVSISVGILFRLRISNRLKWIYSIVVGNVLTTIVFFLNLGKHGLVPAVIYIGMMSIGGTITAYLTHFLIRVKAHTQRMEGEATTDFLTGVNNYRAFDTIFNATVNHAVEKNEPLSLLLVDIDHFKKVNDTYGHLNGDAVLRQAAELLKITSRAEDIISRNGGEEFSVILSGCFLQEARLLAERLIHAFRNHEFVLTDGTKIRITISIGAALLTHQANDNLIEQADIALYKAKTNGRNQVCAEL
jgi:diguanylate cyclase